jgi:hypothetical protein
MEMRPDQLDSSSARSPDRGETTDGALRQANRLLRVAQSLAAAVDSGAVASILCSGLAELTGGGLVAVYTLDENTAPELSAVRIGGKDVFAIPPDVARRALHERRIVAAAPDELADLYERGCSCPEALAAPLLSTGEPL